MIKKLTASILAAAILTGCSCAWLQKQKDPDVAITTIFEVASAITAAGEQAYRAVCGQVAKACYDAKDETCAPLVACQADRDAFTTRMAAVNSLLALAKGENLAGKIEEAKAIEQKAAKLLDEAKAILKSMVGVK